MLNRGDQIGQFILLNKVGSGGFGDVWKAEKRTALDTNYFALKFFRPKDDRIDFDKIGRELGVWKKLKGLPHIISVIELDRFDDYVYVVSDFADGGSLENWLHNNGGKSASQAEAVKITLEILRGLENLHEKGFVHRDLKPDNILIMNGRHCLADFGVSREIKTHSKATGTAGTMEYMPPEAFEKKPSITQQTDIWAVGVILQQLLTGTLPYPQEDYPSLVSAILMYDPEPMPANVPEGLREIVKKTLQKKREDRFQTAREMIEALKNPQEFLAELEPKKSEKFTIIDEDFGKTEQLVIEPIKDLREIEAEKQRQHEEEQAKLEKARLQQEKEERQRLERERLRREPGRIQREREENLRKQKEAEDALQRQQEEKRRGESEAPSKKKVNYLLGSGIIGLVLLLIWGNQDFIFWRSNSSVSVSNSNFANTASSSSEKIFKNSIGMEFVKIPAGSFMMGSDKDNDEKPIHKITINQDFWLQKTEVTQAQWKAVMDVFPSEYSYISSEFLGDSKPIFSVSWDDTQKFIKKLNARNEGMYRLPTEAEWEYAARAGTTSDYAGNLDAMAWYEANSGGKTHPVGTKQANDWGLYDMHGNVWEWCQDLYADNYYANSPSINPTGATSGSDRVFRGGSFDDTADNLRSANRRRVMPPPMLAREFGFRVVRY